MVIVGRFPDFPFSNSLVRCKYLLKFADMCVTVIVGGIWASTEDINSLDQMSTQHTKWHCCLLIYLCRNYAILSVHFTVGWLMPQNHSVPWEVRSLTSYIVLSPHPNRHLLRFSHFSTVHGRDRQQTVTLSMLHL